MTAARDTPAAGIPDQVLAALRGDDWTWLRTTVRRRIERDARASTVLIDIDALTAGQRATLAWLLGWRADRAGQVRVPVARLDDALATRLTHGHGLTQTLEALDGPLADQRAETVRRRAAAEALWTSAASHPALTVHPALGGWLETLRGAGVLPADPDRRRELVQAALDVLATVPVAGVGIGTHSATVLGSAHRLDPGPLHRLVVRGLAHLTGLTKPPTDAAEMRRLWEDFGITIDPYASQVLVLGLAPPGDSPLAWALSAFRSTGTAARVTLDQLDHHVGALCTGTVAFACENPSVLAAAAEQLGDTSPPLVCVEGWPSTAGRQLITRLVADGVHVRYHGDYDWTGLEITQLMLNLGALPWSMTAAQYTRAARTLGDRLRLPPLGTSPQTAEIDWAPGLVGVMNKHGVAVEEEHVIHELIAALTRHRDRDCEPS
jgi:uncharacterized protein (TIGR02679 family)